MKISYNWLKEYINLKVNPQKLAEDLCLFGHEVEDITKIDNDYILDIKFTANRGDCLSILGISREIAALYNTSIKQKLIEVKENNLNKKIHINISIPEICPRFSARIIDNIEIKSSPQWIQDKLTSYGFRTINNIVDITNLVMIETGQPLHAFDYKKIKNGVMNIRLAKDKEYVITLDGKERKLDNDSIIIDDGERIYDLAGIMGGLNSEIDQNTATVVLEAAIFNQTLIRRTSKRLHHTTDASYRFERGVDVSGTIDALNYATHLINLSCKKTLNSEITDKISISTKTKKIAINSSQINKILGTSLKDRTIKELLARLSIKYDNNQASIPSYRAFDLKIYQDIAEEVARVYGYNNIARKQLDITTSNPNNEFIKKEYIKDLLVELGFNEIYSYSFADEKLLTLLGNDLKNCREVLNSVAPENKYLRPSIISSLLTCIAKNPWVPEINIFEIGKVFYDQSEYWELGVASIGKNKNQIMQVINLLGLDIKAQQIEQKALDYLKIRKQVNYFTIKLDDLKINSQIYENNFPMIKYKKISQFPPTIRDLAFIVDNQIDTDHVKSTIYNMSPKIFLVELFDEFSSDKFGFGKKNIAYHIWMQDLSGPLDQEEVDKVSKEIVSEIEKQYEAKFR